MCFLLNDCALRSMGGADRSDWSTPLTPLHSVGHRSSRILKISDLLTILQSLCPLRWVQSKPESGVDFVSAPLRPFGGCQTV